MGQVGVQAVDVHVKDVEIGVTAVVDEMAEVPVVGSVHLKRRRGIIFKPKMSIWLRIQTHHFLFGSGSKGGKN